MTANMLLKYTVALAASSMVVTCFVLLSPVSGFTVFMSVTMVVLSLICLAENIRRIM